MKLHEWQEAMRRATRTEAPPIYWACLKCCAKGLGKMPAEHKHKANPLGRVVEVDIERGTVRVSGS